MVPTLLDKMGQQKYSYLYWTFNEQGRKKAVRKGDWKLIQLNTRSQKNK